MRYARIPQGTKTCGYCYMLASNGLYYKTEESAAAGSHEGCDCIVVSGVDEAKLQYDVKWLRKCWSDCVDTVANDSLRARSRARWDAMPQADREKHAIRVDKKTQAFLDTMDQEKRAMLGISDEQLSEGAFERFHAAELRKEAWREVERRDAGWLYRGVNGMPRDKRGHCWDSSLLTDEQYGRLKVYEKATWDKLAEKHGIVCQVLPEIDAPANIDGIIGSQHWELKNPKNGKHAVEDMVRDTVHKWRKIGLSEDVRLVMSGSESQRPDADLLGEAIRRSRWYGIGELLYVHRGTELITRVLF